MTRPTLKELWEDLKARRRGERRIAPYGTRGRVYAKRNPEAASSASPGHSVATSKASATCHIKVTRADGTVERQTVPATIERN